MEESSHEVAPSVGSDFSRGRVSHQTLGPLANRSETGVLIVRAYWVSGKGDLPAEGRSVDVE